MSLHAGDWVEVRSKEEILRTLDGDGRLDAMPFMPEMFAQCGKRLRVDKCAHKSCDTIHPTSSRSLERTVLLEGIRCDGSAHGGCQAACSVFWKEEWLKPADAPAQAPPAPSAAGCTEADVERAARREDASAGKARYACQATDFPIFSKPLRTRDARQYLTDIRSGNAGVGELVMTTIYFVYDFVFRPERGRLGAPFRWFYDRVQAMWGGVPYPRRRGVLSDHRAAPLVELNLQPGELVRVLPYEEILKTTDSDNNMNRGMRFDAELVPYCGGVFRVRSRVETFVDEKTGYLRHMKTPAVILEQVWCRSRFSNYRLLCPRAIYGWWREAWLERAPEGALESTAESLGRRVILNPSRMQETAE